MKTVLNLIDGIMIPASDGKILNDIGPATGEIIATIPRSNETDVKSAIVAAKNAQADWAALSMNERADWLDLIADSLEKYTEDIASLESLDTGKPIGLARAVDAMRSIKNFRFFAELVREDKQETYLMDDAKNLVVNKPVGIAGLITPWNLPLYLLSWKIAPAIAMGNTVVAKPSELTPLTANLLAEILVEIKLPKGVVNIVHGLGTECGQAIVAHPDIRCISFTGGTETGKLVSITAAPMFKKLSLELGGKNSTIILDDADLNIAVSESARAAFLNQGQVCLCGSRLLVHNDIWNEFVPRFISHVRSMKIGDPSNEETELGALVSLAHLEKVEAYIQLALDEGGEILTGGSRFQPPPPFSGGAFLEPTVIKGLKIDSRCSTEEIFGPVVTLHRFDDDQEAIMYANNTEYGLAGSVWTTNLERGEQIAESIESGMVWVNCWLHRDLRVPFGGVKSSGLGREGGYRSLDFFSEAMNICIRH